MSGVTRSLRVDALLKKKTAPASKKGGKKAAAPVQKAAKGGKGELKWSAGGVRPSTDFFFSSLSAHPSARPFSQSFPGNYFRGSADAALSKWYGEFFDTGRERVCGVRGGEGKKKRREGKKTCWPIESPPSFLRRAR